VLPSFFVYGFVFLITELVRLIFGHVLLNDWTVMFMYLLHHCRFGPRESKKAMLYSDTGRLNCSVSYTTFATGIRGQACYLIASWPYLKNFLIPLHIFGSTDSVHLYFRDWKTKNTQECFIKPLKAQLCYTLFRRQPLIFLHWFLSLVAVWY
jgi:hypothetical protein